MSKMDIHELAKLYKTSGFLKEMEQMIGGMRLLLFFRPFLFQMHTTYLTENTAA